MSFRRQAPRLRGDSRVGVFHALVRAHSWRSLQLGIAHDRVEAPGRLDLELVFLGDVGPCSLGDAEAAERGGHRARVLGQAPEPGLELVCARTGALIFLDCPVGSLLVEERE